jgi:hypothetical protein
MKSNDLTIERPKTSSKIFAYTRWDIIPVLAGLLHAAFFFGMFYLFPRVPLWVMLILGFIFLKASPQSITDCAMLTPAPATFVISLTPTTSLTGRGAKIILLDRFRRFSRRLCSS